QGKRFVYGFSEAEFNLYMVFSFGIFVSALDVDVDGGAGCKCLHLCDRLAPVRAAVNQVRIGIVTQFQPVEGYGRLISLLAENQLPDRPPVLRLEVLNAFVAYGIGEVSGVKSHNNERVAVLRI